jgi:HPt (histidine-containing phosphotransfer) domain-containing protein
VAFASHTLRGACANIGAAAMAGALQELEALSQDGSLDGAAELLAVIEHEHTRVVQALDARDAHEAEGRSP